MNYVAIVIVIQTYDEIYSTPIRRGVNMTEEGWG